jgi:hypothetical protein
MNPETEAHFLRLWYTLMQILFVITTPIYLILPVKRFYTTNPYRGYRIMLPLLSSFASLCLFTEASNLARPVYVCFYPVRGETFHHPEEMRLTIKWKLNLLACVLAGVTGVNNFAEKMILGEARENQLVKASSGSKEAKKYTGFEISVGGMQEQKDREQGLLQRWWRGGRAGEVLMMSAWVVGMCGYWAMLGRSKEGKFGF